MTTDIAKIATGLTKAQREARCRASAILRHLPTSPQVVSDNTPPRHRNTTLIPFESEADNG